MNLKIFKYERLSNICYWCGRVTHDDKDCPILLKSKWALKMKDQQFVSINITHNEEYLYLYLYCVVTNDDEEMRSSGRCKWIRDVANRT